ncbi:YfjI family protein [Acinetobacter baumannii]|uniref:YfjI family protein n=1 Tax=Acinetobacter baumannii TaxID=470 RepID=UPI0032B3DAFA
MKNSSLQQNYKNVISSINWKEPKYFGTELLPVPKLEREMLPKELADYVFGEARRADNMPPDLIAICLITVLGSLIGSRVAIKPKKLDDWNVVPNLWGAIVAPPSSKKTPAMNAGTRPLDYLVDKAKIVYAKKCKEFEVTDLVHQAQEKKLKDILKKAEDVTDLERIASNLMELQDKTPSPPILKRYMTNDSTPEALAEIQKDNPAGILSKRDELIGLLSSLEQNDSDTGRSYYLEGWNGTGSYTFDRVMRGTGYIKNHCLSILGGIQPDKLISYLEKSVNGHGNDGLIQRFQLLVYPETSNWKYVDEKPDNNIRNNIYQLFERIDELQLQDFIAIGANHINGLDSRPYFNFCDDAQILFINWTTALHTQKIPHEEYSVIQEHLSKYSKLMPSLALIFHIVDCILHGYSGGVSKAATELAILWCNYLEAHAKRVYGLVTHSSTLRANILLQKIQKIPSNHSWYSEGFTARLIAQKKWKNLTTVEFVNDALEVLVENHWLEFKESEPSDQGGRPSKRFFINPKIRK